MSLRVICISMFLLISFSGTAADTAGEVVASGNTSDSYAEIGFSLRLVVNSLIEFNNQNNLEKSTDTQSV